MYDKALIQRFCNLTCTKNDLDRKTTTIKYDTLHPFKTYYSVESIKGAINKFISKEWDDRTLAHWACVYCWIIGGGFDYKNITEDLNSFEKFFRDYIIWDLDGLSFFCSKDFDDDVQCLHNAIELYEDYDHIWKTRNEWDLFYSIIDPLDRENGHQHIVLVNDKIKEYMILHCDHLENGFEDQYIKFVPRKKFIKLVERLKRENYKILSCDETHYYRTLENS